MLLQPTSKQTALLRGLLAGQQQLYNAALEARRGAWRWSRTTVTRLDQYNQLTGWDHPVLTYGVTPARGTLLRLDRAFASFFRRVKAGQTPGYPRFKSATRWDSVEYPETHSWQLIGSGNSGRLYLPGVCHVRYRCSRYGVRGRPKTLVVKREGRRWRAYVACVVEAAEPLPSTGRAVGIDLGVEHLVATSEGSLVNNDRHYKRNLNRLASAQTLMAGRKRGSNRRRKAAGRVGELHRRVARKRRDGLHKLSRALVSDYDLIVHEDLKITNMTRRPRAKPTPEGDYAPNGARAKAGLNREILSAGWGGRIQVVGATSSLNRSAGVSHPRVFRGRVLSR